MLQGAQLPRILHVPPNADNEAQDVIDLAASVGLHLDPWQQNVLLGALGVNADGSWSAFEVGLIVPRQNGKGSILEALVLAWLFLFDEHKVLFSAHEMKTAQEMYKRIRERIKDSAELRSRVANFYQSNERTAIVLHDGSECRFLARSDGSGRGFSASKIIFDEAFNLPDSVADAQLPTTGAQENPQVWYTSSAGDVNIGPCDVLARIRRRGMTGDAPNLAFFEWSVEFDEETRRIKGNPGDPRLWAQANPSMGLGKPWSKRESRIAALHGSLSAEGFAREELSVGNYPTDDEEGKFFNPGKWSAGADPDSTIAGSLVLAVAVSVDRSRATIGSAGLSPSGKLHLEPIRTAHGLGWIVEEALRLQVEHRPGAFVIDGGGPGADLVEKLRDAGVNLTVMDLDDVKTASTLIFDTVEAGEHAHLNDPDLNAAVKGAKKRDIGDRFAIGRRKSTSDVTPFEAVTFAAWGVSQQANYDVLESIG